MPLQTHHNQICSFAAGHILNLQKTDRVHSDLHALCHADVNSVFLTSMYALVSWITSILQSLKTFLPKT
jgi:hypothetical protein